MSGAALQRAAAGRVAPALDISVTILNRQRRKRVNTAALKRMALAVFVDLGIQHAELGVHLVSAGTMARVNWQYLRHEGSTDVITFDHTDEVKGGRGPEGRLYGELFVCVDDAVKQAREFRTTWQTEIVRYVIHGVLHLLGHDDMQPEPRRKMKREENRLVRRLGGRQ
jgi:probable rRNA maturation factor